MTYPRLASQASRDRAAAALRRWRQLRDESNARAATFDAATDPFTIRRAGEWASARYFQGKADGYREALRDLFGE